MQATTTKSAVFGLNWLQDRKPFELTGEYNPDKELWFIHESASAGSAAVTAYRTADAADPRFLDTDLSDA